MDDKRVQSNTMIRWKTLSREQKISVSILSFFGLIVLGLSFGEIIASINDPFTIKKGEFLQAKQVVDDLHPDQRLLEESKRRDTDGDGLSDYDEEKLYATSPYMRDTDGDGLPDNVELATGEDPLCMQGRICANPALDLTLVATTSQFLLPNISGLSGDQLYAEFQRGANVGKQQIIDATGSTSTALEAGLVRDPAVIRKVIQDSGKIDQAVLDRITDDQLLQLYDQAVIENAKSQAQDSSGKTAGDANLLDQSD